MQLKTDGSGAIGRSYIKPAMILLMLALLQSTTFSAEILIQNHSATDISANGRAFAVDGSPLIIPKREFTPCSGATPFNWMGTFGSINFTRAVTPNALEFSSSFFVIGYSDRDGFFNIASNKSLIEKRNATIRFDPVIGEHLFKGESGRSTDDMVGIFSIQKEIKLSEGGLCTEDGSDWLSTS